MSATRRSSSSSPAPVDRFPEQNAVEVGLRPPARADELTGLAGDWFDVIPLSGARVALVVVR